MNEDLVLHILNTACYGLNLQFSLIPQAPYLYIFFDRDADQVLDYPTLTETIRQAVVSSGVPPEYEYLGLYSRILGYEEPDWETAIYMHSVPPIASETIVETEMLDFGEENAAEHPVEPLSLEDDAPAVEPTLLQSTPEESPILAAIEEEITTLQTAAGRSSQTLPPPPPPELLKPLPPVEEIAQLNSPIQEPDDLSRYIIRKKLQTPPPPPEIIEPEPETEAIREFCDLSRYCFIRNKLLLTSAIKPPSGAVIGVLKTFSAFSAAEQEEGAHLLDQLFRHPPKSDKEEGSGEAVLYQVGQVDLQTIQEPLQGWLRVVMDLDPESFRKSAIWFSRYCYNAQATIDELGI